MRFLLIFVLSTSLGVAQYPASANALRWDGTASGGPFCWGFNCTPAVVAIQAGETGTLTVRAEWMQPYLLAASFNATACTTFPGIHNQLVLDDPITVWAQGVCTTTSPILACPSGTDSLTLTIPAGLVPGTTVSIQGLTATPPFPGSPFTASFTQTLTFVVQ